MIFVQQNSTLGIPPRLVSASARTTLSSFDVETNDLNDSADPFSKFERCIATAATGIDSCAALKRFRSIKQQTRRLSQHTGDHCKTRPLFSTPQDVGSSGSVFIGTLCDG